MKIQPYLCFEGRCEEAIGFYQRALGAEVRMLMRFKDTPAPQRDDGGCAVTAANGDKIMHAEIEVGGHMILCSDGMMKSAPEFKGFGLAAELPDAATTRRWFDALGDGGNVCMPLERTFWSPLFGMVTDRFGVTWMLGQQGE